MTDGVEIAPQRGWYYGWNIVAAGVLAQVAANGLVLNSFSLFLHDWSLDLRSPISTLQLAFVFIGVMNAVAAVVAGIMADKYPVRWLFCGGFLTMALSCVAISFMTQTWQLIFLYALPIPWAVSFSSLPATAVVSRWFVRRRGLALGLTAFGLGLAGIVLPPLVAAFMPELGWRMIWRTGGLVIAMIVAPMVVFVMRDRPAPHDGLYYLTGSSAGTSTHGVAGDAARDLTWRAVFRRRNFWLLVVVYLPMIALYGVGLSNLGPIAENRGMSPRTAGYLLSIFSLAQTAATLILGLLSDRFGNRRPLVGLAFVTALGGLAIAFGGSVGVLGLGVILIGVGGGVWTLLAAAIAAEFGSAGFGRAYGLLLLFLPLIVLTPFIVAKVQEVTGSYVPSLLGLMALTVAGGIACSFLRERHDGEAAASA